MHARTHTDTQKYTHTHTRAGAQAALIIHVCVCVCVCVSRQWGDGPTFVFSVITLCPLAERLGFVTGMWTRCS